VGVSAPDALYILWRHHVPIRTRRGSPFPPPVSLPIAWPARPPQPPVVSQAAAGQFTAGPAGPAGEGRTFLVKEVAVITGRRLDAVYNHIYTGKLWTDDSPPDGGGFTRSARRT
jgi:hypothetical protein